MYQTHKVYITEDMVLSDLVLENPSLLLMMEFFNIKNAIKDDTVAEICQEYHIHLSTFLLFANLYNGFSPNNKEINATQVDISTIIRFLKQTHLSYINDKYPKIKGFIKQLYEKQNATEIERIEFFFNDYFDEVLEHLRYEDEIAFPYFCKLLVAESNSNDLNFSVNEYRIHHSDIGIKLSDLKNLLIKHIALTGDFPLKREIITSLFELERDLNIHSTIEDLILLPIVDELEKRQSIG